MLDCGADPDTKTALIHPEFPCKEERLVLDDNFSLLGSLFNQSLLISYFF